MGKEEFVDSRHLPLVLFSFYWHVHLYRWCWFSLPVPLAGRTQRFRGGLVGEFGVRVWGSAVGKVLAEMHWPLAAYVHLLKSFTSSRLSCWFLLEENQIKQVKNGHKLERNRGSTRAPLFSQMKGPGREMEGAGEKIPGIPPINRPSEPTVALGILLKLVLTLFNQIVRRCSK